MQTPDERVRPVGASGRVRPSPLDGLEDLPSEGPVHPSPGLSSLHAGPSIGGLPAADAPAGVGDKPARWSSRGGLGRPGGRLHARSSSRDGGSSNVAWARRKPPRAPPLGVSCFAASATRMREDRLDLLGQTFSAPVRIEVLRRCAEIRPSSPIAPRSPVRSRRDRRWPDRRGIQAVPSISVGPAPRSTQGSRRPSSRPARSPSGAPPLPGEGRWSSRPGRTRRGCRGRVNRTAAHHRLGREAEVPRRAQRTIAGPAEAGAAPSPSWTTRSRSNHSCASGRA